MVASSFRGVAEPPRWGRVKGAKYDVPQCRHQWNWNDGQTLSVKMQLMECSQAVVDFKIWAKGRGPELAFRGGNQRPHEQAVLAHRTAARVRLVGRRGARPQRPRPPIGRRRRSATAHTPIARASRVGVARAPTPPTKTPRTHRAPAPRPRPPHAVRACIAGRCGRAPSPPTATLSAHRAPEQRRRRPHDDGERIMGRRGPRPHAQQSPHAHTGRRRRGADTHTPSAHASRVGVTVPPPPKRPHADTGRRRRGADAHTPCAGASRICVSVPPPLSQGRNLCARHFNAALPR